MTRALPLDSLRTRLTFAAALVLAAFLGLAGLVLERAFQRGVVADVRQQLQTRVYLLLGAAELDAAGRPRMPEALAEPRLGTPGSGLYAAVRGADGALLWRSDSSLGRDIEYPRAGAPGEPVFARVPAADGGTLHALAYPVTWEREDGSTRRLAFLVAESAAGAEARVAGFRRTLWAWFAGLAAVLLAAQAAVLHWGLGPLRRAAREVAAIEAGERERLGAGYPRELRPLTENLNALIAGSAARLQRYRDALADLAHSLKTPLAVLRALDADGAGGEGARTVREQAERMERAVDWHLQRAAAAGGAGLARAVPVADAIARLAASLAKVHAARAVTFESAVAPGTTFRGDPEDLMEIAGNLLDNAWKWCARCVRVRAHAEGDRLTLVVEDDGPGIPPARRRAVLARGARADESVPGEGIGLDIVRRLVEEAYAGGITLDSSGLGGLRVTVTLPGRGPRGGARR